MLRADFGLAQIHGHRQLDRAALLDDTSLTDSDRGQVTGFVLACSITGLPANISNSMIYKRLIVISLLFDYVYQGDTRLGRAEVVFVLTALELAAGGALVLVVIRVDVAQADRASRFQRLPRIQEYPYESPTPVAHPW